MLGLLLRVGRVRGLEMVGVSSSAEAATALARQPFGVVVVDLHLGAKSGLDVVREARAQDAPAEAIVISADRRQSSALESYAQDVFAFVPKPFDPVQLVATVERALERRRGALERQRPTWELRLLKEVATTVSSSIEITEALQGGLEQVADAYQVRWGVLRLRPLDGGPLVVRAAHGAPIDLVSQLYAGRADWPSDAVMRDRTPVRDGNIPGDLMGALQATCTIRSALSVPVQAGAEAHGVLTLASEVAQRFDDHDERVLMAIGRQFGVAVANGQLYERVHRAKVQWERTFDAISDPIALFDSRARTLRVNAALAEVQGWPIHHTHGRTCDEVGLCGGGCPDCLVGRTLRDGERLAQEITTTAGRIFAVTTVPVADASGAAVLIAKEMTEEHRRARQLRTLSQEVSATNAELVATVNRLRTTQTQLVQAEKLSAIGQLVAGVAHELNNPLTSVIGYAQLVQEAVMSKPALAAAGRGLTEDVSRIVSESDRAARIVRNLLTFARQQTAERSRHDIVELCQHVVDLRAYDSRLNGIEVVSEYEDGLPPIYVDGGQIQQALLNLVLNAEQAMKESKDRRLTLAVASEPACGAIVLRVADTGHGIEAGNRTRVFDPFFTTRGVGEGTGLGLSIVYGIVRDHGGQIWIDSEVGKGTTFSIRLPVRTAAVWDPASGQFQPLALVAHADSVTRDFIAAALAGWGCAVRPVPNAREALESLVEDAVTLAVVDRTVIEGDPHPWTEAWARVRDHVALIALARGADDENSGAFGDAAARLAAPYELCALRDALMAALKGGRGTG